MSRFFLVECHTGRIWSVPREGAESVCHADLARKLDERLCRHGRSYAAHARNPAPGEALGYYVYRVTSDEPLAGASRFDPVRNWTLVGFVEVIQGAVVDRVWIEPHAGGFVVCSTGGEDFVTISPVSLADAERIALDFAERTGAFLAPMEKSA